MIEREVAMPKTKHDRIAEQIAKKRKGEYNPVKGPDIVTQNFAVEIEVDKNKLSEGIRQLQGIKKRAYIAVPDKILKDAIERTKRTTIGVMDERGKILKPSTRKKK